VWAWLPLPRQAQPQELRREKPPLKEQPKLRAQRRRKPLVMVPAHVLLPVS
jgi:hypothetical protein